MDLHTGLAPRLPVAIICRLLGVPERDGDSFRSLSERMASDSADGDAHRVRT